MRHFDAPEAIETRFYEVRAKSILNHVPPASQMPFRWTINPYRGCTHACTLLQRWRDADPDGRRTPQADLRARSRRRDLRDARRWIWLSALRPHHRPRQVDHGQAGLPAHARVRDRADSQRRSPVAEQSRVEARRAQRARPARPAVSDDPQSPGGDGTGSATAGARRRLPPWIPVRNHPRRRFAARIRLPSGGWLALHRLSLPACARRTSRRSTGRAGFLASVEISTSERVFQVAAGGRREMTAISAQAASSFERISGSSSGRYFRACSGVAGSSPGSSTPRDPAATSR